MPRSVSLSSIQLAAVLIVALVAGGVGAMVLDDAPTDPTEQPQTDDGPNVSTFDSAEEFRSYLQEADRTGSGGFGAQTGAVRSAGTADVAAEDDAGGDGARPEPEGTAAPVATESSGGGGGGDTERRASDTNVQVEGIDEPDILKTRSDTLYYSPRDGPRHHGDEGREGVRLIDADDPAAPEVASRLDVSGQLLLSGDTLVVFENDRLVGYDVSDREEPQQAWTKRLDDRVVTARLHAGTVYLVTADGIDRENPCPVEPMEGVSVSCSDVHHPTEPVPVDTTYTVSMLDPDDGSVDDTAAFVGVSRGSVGRGSETVVHVSTDSVYVTYPKPVDETDLMAEFLLTNQSERLDEETIDRIEEIQSYDLSPRAKRIEMQAAIRQWLEGMDDEERRKAERALREDLQAWAEENKREFARTGIVAFDVTDADTDSPTVEAGATGTVPGRPLNQFSMDEHDGEFRIATTIPRAMGAESENDLYVLDADNLETTGSVQGMGVTERIYSVRYVGDQAYVVTFRRIDPFHVVDLSDPENPTVEGELKLPGFSSYLHPLDDDRVLGIGEENGKVKLVIFDVSDPQDPTIEEDRILDTRFSAVAESHHAFLMDRRHGVFFLPTNGEVRGGDPIPETEDGTRHDGGVGYVFSYEDGLSVETTVETQGPAQRAAYVGDYLYVFGTDSLTVVDEETWEETETVEFTEG